jgi:uncharacterized protein with ATP-grasp and redox domains
MKTYLDCIPCFFKQALEAARIAGAGRATQKRVLTELAASLATFPLTCSPPEMGRIIYRLVKKATRESDPYLEIKTRSNRFALNIYERLRRKVSSSPDRLLMAVKLSIAGNIIDYGVKNSLDVDSELKKILNQESRAIKQEKRGLFDYTKFKATLRKAKTVVYLADNAGETVFDHLLIEEIKRIDRFKKIIYAVKDKPVINDALAKDACVCGIDKLARVISSGSDAPGTILSLCSTAFLKIYRKADMVISKGQGNFEALSAARRMIFFLFMAKCPVVAGDIGCKLGDIILICNSRKDINANKNSF